MAGHDICAMLMTPEVPCMVRELPKEALRELAEEITALQSSAMQLGASREAVQDAARQELHLVVSEIYSPPRVTRAARMLPHLGITPGFALDLIVEDQDGKPWGFDDPQKRNKAVRKLLEEKPDLLVGSPECTDFSPWQRLNKAKSPNPEKYAEARRKAVRHLEFVCKLYKLQRDAGRRFLNEH